MHGHFQGSSVKHTLAVTLTHAETQAQGLDPHSQGVGLPRLTEDENVFLPFPFPTPLLRKHQRLSLPLDHKPQELPTWGSLGTLSWTDRNLAIQTEIRR